VSIDELEALNEADESPTSAEDADANIETVDSSNTDTEDAKEEESKESLLEAVKAVVEEDEVSEEKSSDSESGEEGEPEVLDEVKADDSGTEKVELTEEERKENERLDKIPRFKEVLNERDSYKERAESYDQIREYMTANNLLDREVAELFQAGALLKNDTMQGINVLDRYLHDLKVQVGMELPEDLQDQVDQGLVYPDTARELSQARSENELLKRQREAESVRQQQEQVAVSQQNIFGAVEEWETRTAKVDPDFARKQKLVEDKVGVFVSQRGYPQTAEQAVKWADEAYGEINSTLSSMMPKKTPTKPTPSGQVSTNARPAAKTLLEAVTQAANG